MALAYNSLGEMQGDPYILEKALESFAHSARLHDGLEPHFWNDWGAALMRMTEMTGSQAYLIEAIEKFEYAIAVQGGDQDTTVVDPQLLYNYGCALDFLGDFSDDEQHYQHAIKVLTQVVILDPDFVHARYNLGLAWSHLAELISDIESFEKAGEQFQRSVTIDSEDEMAWNDWGLALLNLSRMVNDPMNKERADALQEEAEAKLLHAVGLGSLPALYNLVCLYSLDHNYEAAMHYLQRAQASGALPPLNDVVQDEWLESLRETEAFRAFILQFSNPLNE
jgi:tetratricopeptide (TPR) repeat protein